MGSGVLHVPNTREGQDNRQLGAIFVMRNTVLLK